MKVSNILDPIADELSPYLWEDPKAEKPKLKAAHDQWIEHTIHQVLKDAGYTDSDKWLTLVLTGSLTTYQYGHDSDVDTSLFVDTKVFPDWSRAEMIGLMVSKVDGVTLPGTPYPMQCFVVDSLKVGKTDLYKPGLRSGYDIDQKRWIVPPERSRAHDVEAEQNGFYVYALQMADKMERLLRYEPDKAIQFWHQIHARRRRDQMAGKGDYAESNIVYKFLAKRGLLPDIAQTSGEYIAKKASPGGMGFGTMYHVSPRKNRRSIQEHGLEGFDKGRRENSPWNYTWDQPPGNYMFDNPGDAYDYATMLHHRQNSDEYGVDDDFERRYEYPEPPHDFHTWPEDKQDEWNDNAEPVERTEDPEGYDIHAVQAHGLPLAPDPESQVTNNPGDLGEVYDDYEYTKNNLYPQQIPSPGLHDEVADAVGFHPRRYYSPSNIPPNRITLHQHVPGWDVPSRDDMYDNYGIMHGEGYPSTWDAVPMTSWPMPGHEAKTSADTRVLYNKFRPDPVHPGKKVMPWIYDPKDDIVHLGPPAAYHWQLINRTPELKSQFNPENMWSGASTGMAPGLVHGTMQWPSKQSEFLSPDVPHPVKQQINNALGGPPLPDPEQITPKAWDFD